MLFESKSITLIYDLAQRIFKLIWAFIHIVISYKMSVCIIYLSLYKDVKVLKSLIVIVTRKWPK